MSLNTSPRREQHPDEWLRFYDPTFSPDPIKIKRKWLSLHGKELWVAVSEHCWPGCSEAEYVEHLQREGYNPDKPKVTNLDDYRSRETPQQQPIPILTPVDLGLPTVPRNWAVPERIPACFSAVG